MKFTNKFDLPAPMYKALIHDDYVSAGDISVTALIMPPRIRQLKLRHDDQIAEDVSDRIWMLMGNMGHVLLEWAEVKNAFQEERLSCQVNGWIVTGKMDLYEPPATLSDYKVTSTWSVIYGKPEWEKQLNLYAYLYRTAGFRVNKLQIVAVLRDWVKSRAKKDKGYPQCAVKIVPVGLWPDVLPYLTSRVILHQMAVNLDDDNLPECTPEERWERPTTFAVKKNRNKTAVRVYEDPLQAQQRMKQLQFQAGKKKTPAKYWIEDRPGESVRCENYCNVNRWCNQYQKLKQEEE